MLLPAYVDGRRVDGSFDLARFTGFPIYFFDLEPVLAHTRSALVRDAERLRAVCEQHLGALGASEVMMFSGSGFYLVVQSCLGTAALGLANRINLALLKLFFGTDSLVPARLRTMFQRVMPTAATKARQRPQQLAAEPENEFDDPDTDSEVPDMTPEKRAAFVHLAAQGRLQEQNVELSFVPVHDLRRRRVTTFFCSPVSRAENSPRVYGYGAFEGMSRHDWPFVDRAILAYAIKFARRLASSGIVAAIGTSVNFETLAWSKGRKMYCQALRAVGVSEFPFLILKIEDVPAGILPGRLSDIVSAVHPLVKRVFVHLPDCETPTHQCGHLGTTGLVLSLPPKPSPIVAMGRAKWLVRACEAQNALSCIDRIDSDATLELVRLAGVRFGVGHVFGAQEFHGDAEPAAVEAFMEDVARTAPDDRKAVARLH